ncbi:hydrolase 1, exosortase A system-associated [Rubrivivax benzoatilyticus]|uniref:hydrolase 1, exosortase A system-associated n=1 Tax=Rubrivivax benzoatilyticus TaxID=316997 RepID=UPI002872D509|nr:hydrolase 1, exosortase A system-associated [Rubrivivax benzoatilyticus]
MSRIVAAPDAWTNASEAWGQVSQDLTPPAAAAPGAAQAFAFACEGETLLGVLHRPPAGAPAAATGVVIVVGGPQYRAGSHRQFVHLARALAAGGHPVLRFDVRGMGDSSGALRSFEQITPDIGAAVDTLAARAGVGRVVLWGLCDGASAALLYLHERRDPRVAGVCLLNPWVRSEASLARTHVKHYYTRRLREREFWLKLLSGRVAGRALAELWRNLRRARGEAPPAAARTAGPFQQRMAEGWRGFGGGVLLVLSGDDYTAKEFLETCDASPAWQALLRRPGTRRQDLATADHTLSARADRDTVAALTLDWLQRLAARTP